jgi:hypothetical protein
VTRCYAKRADFPAGNARILSGTRAHATHIGRDVAFWHTLQTKLRC